jgi:hypothetical protein
VNPVATFSRDKTDSDLRPAPFKSPDDPGPWLAFTMLSVPLVLFVTPAGFVVDELMGAFAVGVSIACGSVSFAWYRWAAKKRERELAEWNLYREREARSR